METKIPKFLKYELDNTKTKNSHVFIYEYVI